MQEHLFDHFKSEGHSDFLGNVSITLIDKTDGKAGSYPSTDVYSRFSLKIQFLYCFLSSVAP